MTDTVSVAADDLRCVTGVLSLATRAFGAALGQIPGFGAALEACGRLADAAESSVLPPDPVTGPLEGAVSQYALMDAYIQAGFEREEAFALLMFSLSVGMTRHLHG